MNAAVQPAKEKRKPGRPAGIRLKLICLACEREFELSGKDHRRRMKQRLRVSGKSDGLFCSKGCAANAQCGEGFYRKGFNRVTLKPRAWRTDEQQYWEQVLHDEGLGEGVGRNVKLLYGLHEFIEGKDGKIVSRIREQLTF